MCKHRNQIFCKRVYYMKHVFQLLIFCFTLITTDLISDDEWYQAPPLMVPRGAATAINHNGYIYVFGGKSFDNKVLNSVEMYDLETHVWDTTAVPPFQFPRYNASVVAFEGKIYLLGGRDNKDIRREVEVYDPVQNNWSSAHDLRRNREGLAGAVFNDRIYAIGGQEDNYKLIDEIEWYDQPADNWLDAVFNLPYPRAAHFSGVEKNTFYMFGGYYYGPTAECYKAEPGTSGYQWIRLNDLDRGRAYGASAKVRNEIFLLGGETSDGKTNTVQVFNTDTELFGPCEPFSAARSGLAAVTVRDTIIFIIGGFETSLNEPVATVEYYYGNLTTAIGETTSQLPVNHILIKGYPNPFNNTINLEVTVPVHDDYEIVVFDITGRKIATIYKAIMSKGSRLFRWQAGEEISSGIYFLTAHSNDFIQNYKLIYVK